MARPERYPSKKLIGFDQSMLDAIDGWRREQTPLPNFSDAVRNILEEWLIAHGYLPPQAADETD